MEGGFGLVPLYRLSYDMSTSIGNQIGHGVCTLPGSPLQHGSPMSCRFRGIGFIGVRVHGVRWLLVYICSCCLRCWTMRGSVGRLVIVMGIFFSDSLYAGNYPVSRYNDGGAALLAIRNGSHHWFRTRALMADNDVMSPGILGLSSQT